MKKNFRAAVALQIRISVELRERLESVKEETGKSLNQIIVEILEGHLIDESYAEYSEKSKSESAVQLI